MLTWHFIHFENKKAWEMALDLGGEIWGANQQKGSSAVKVKSNLKKKKCICLCLYKEAVSSPAKKKLKK